MILIFIFKFPTYKIHAVFLQRPIMFRPISISFSIALFLFSPISLAAPFCVSSSNIKKCDYYDYSSCISAAGSWGICTLNEMEMKSPMGEAPYCLATVYSTKCSYYDESTCKADSNFASVCIKNKNLR